MTYSHQGSAQRLCRIVTSILLALPASGSLANKSLPVAVNPEFPSIIYDDVEEHLASEVLPLSKRSGECEAALRRSLEYAPELLALANWPLDSAEPIECVSGGVAPTVAVNEEFVPEKTVPDTVGLADMMALVDMPELDADLDNLAEAFYAASESLNPLGGKLLAVDNAALDEIRGGFELADSNLKFSFGIERAVFINGQLVASNVMNLKDLNWVAGGGSAPQVLNNGTISSVGVIQNGAGNGFAAQIGANLAGTVVQNTLNNQTIQNVTTINASVNSAQAMRALSVQSAIQNGIVDSLRR